MQRFMSLIRWHQKYCTKLWPWRGTHLCWIRIRKAWSQCHATLSNPLGTDVKHSSPHFWCPSFSRLYLVGIHSFEVKPVGPPMNKVCTQLLNELQRTTAIAAARQSSPNSFPWLLRVPWAPWPPNPREIASSRHRAESLLHANLLSCCRLLNAAATLFFVALKKFYCECLYNGISPPSIEVSFQRSINERGQISRHCRQSLCWIAISSLSFLLIVKE